MSLTPEHVDCHSFTDMPTACPSGLTGTRTGWTHPPTVPHSAQFPWESMRGSASSITSPCLLIPAPAKALGWYSTGGLDAGGRSSRAC